MTDYPLSYLTAAGRKALDILPLTIGVTALSVFVVLLISVLLLVAVFRQRPAGDPQALIQSAEPLRWVNLGIMLTIIALVGVLIWTMSTVAAVIRPPQDSALTLEVTGHQWWWEVRYLDKDHPSNVFTTANEIHIPAGKPIKINLMSADVIHSFWVPSLAGKTDTIPGQTNEIWLQADRFGTYAGQCTEYCGQQHAHMAFSVIADDPEKFEAWRQAQLIGKAPPDDEAPADIQQRIAFQHHCGACHTVRGTAAGGRVGPDLTHVMSRQTIAAGTLPNVPGWIDAWVADPQHFKPGAKMPILDINGPQFHAVTNYLATLR